MSWRTVVVSSRCKLDLKMGYMVIRGEDIRQIFLDEIAIVMIENPAVSMTGCLLSELMNRKIKVILCDNRHSPQAEMVPFYGSHDTSKKIRMQIGWKEIVKGAVWGQIVSEKILQQSIYLREQDHEREADLLLSYISQLEFQDASNREGHAAKVYFNAMFGNDFFRGSSAQFNAALDYGYTILLSAFNREVSANGYLTQIGIHHGNVFNRYNLSCDLMEPFRVLVDRVVWDNKLKELDKDGKRLLANVLNKQVTICGTNQTVMNAISIYCRSVFDALNETSSNEITMWKL